MGADRRKILLKTGTKNSGKGQDYDLNRKKAKRIKKNL